MSEKIAPKASGFSPITSAQSRIHDIAATASNLRAIDAKVVDNDDDLLAEIGYKQELKRRFSTFQIFGIAYSIMGILPSVASLLGTALSAGPAGAVWSWAVASIFILTIGISMSELASSIPTSDTGFPMAQVIYDSLGRRWAIAFMSLMAGCQWLMGSSLLTAASRQIWAFARDDGLPFCSIVKVVNKKLRVPIRAVILACLISLAIGCLCLAGTAAANALFSLGVLGNYLAWCTPVFLKLTFGKHKFNPGSFYLGPIFSPIIGWIACAWGAFITVLVCFPATKSVTKEDMNYCIVITGGVWILSIVFFFTYKYKYYHGPRSNLDDDNIEVVSSAEDVSYPHDEKV
ncbi:hypothetical protein PMKS-003568 [Pichia membranifaciens]|uniref:Amino acid permease/ SLC12A domain-containing protein n=1 Tax=Pichia membranifaciens TaxID=4926 RepID=A0A1Q2YKJ5_9ASCO|nr:hypothetical protein PMKS-003568 [Pichia membranifaciens]